MLCISFHSPYLAYKLYEKKGGGRSQENTIGEKGFLKKHVGYSFLGE